MDGLSVAGNVVMTIKSTDAQSTRSDASGLLSIFSNQDYNLSHSFALATSSQQLLVMSSFDCFSAEVMEMIIARLDHQGQVALSEASGLFRNYLPSFELPTIKLHQRSDVITISSFSLDRQITQQFFACHNQSIRTWKMKSAEKGKFNCFRTFAFPPTEKFSFFSAARIGHLEMNKLLPIYLDNDNVDYLTTLLSGCIVDKISLIIDKDSLANVEKLPSFFASIQAKHVEFHLEKTMYYDLLAPFLKEGFALALAEAGVREVTFSGDLNYGRILKVEPSRYWSKIRSPRHGRDKSSFAFDLLLNLVEGGIERVNVNPDALDNYDRDVTREELDQFIDHLSSLNRSARLDLSLKHSFKSPIRICEENDDQKKGLVVTSHRPTCGHCRVNIEFQLTN